jgi:hypothetical protein
MTSAHNKSEYRSHSRFQRLINWAPALVVALISALAFTLASYQVGFVYGQDFPAHIRWAQRLAENGLVYLPHYSYQQLIVILRALLPIGSADLLRDGLSTWLAARSYKIAGLLVVAIFYALTAYILQRRLANNIRSAQGKNAEILSALLTLSLMLVTPITLLTLADHRLYLGYIGINVYHNPTVTMLKPLALLLFWAVTDRLVGENPPLNILWLGGLTIFSTLTKPNFSLGLLPALILLILYRWLQKNRGHWIYLGFGFILPALLVLGYQYWYGYISSDATRVVFAPLREMHFYAPVGLGWMFLFSILFPLCVLIFRFRQVIRDQRLLLVWGAFLISSAMTYLLAEEGGREYNLNFQWGAQVSLFIIFIQSVLLLINQWKLKGAGGKPMLPTWQKHLLGFTFGLHVLSGVLWYLAEVIQPHQWWY